MINITSKCHVFPLQLFITIYLGRLSTDMYSPTISNCLFLPPYLVIPILAAPPIHF